MPLLFLHALFAAILFGSVFADVFFLRSPGSLVVEPKAAILKWRAFVSWLQMGSFVAVFGLGLWQWIPNMGYYHPAIFHSKATLALVFLVLAKARMLRERKTGEPGILLTRIMFVILLVVYCLGLSSRFGLN
jgi:hypothetical protein